MKKSVYIFISISILFVAVLFVSPQFLVMPWENMNLPKLENPRLVVRKKERKLEVFDGDKMVKSYQIVLGSTPVGDKEREGDGKTPEGDFFVFTRNEQSKFYLSLGVSYPSINDAKRGLAQNIITPADYDAIVEAINEKRMPPQKTALGGEIYIHGGGTLTDWTDGCVALRNEEMKEIFEAIPVGTSIRIEP